MVATVKGTKGVTMAEDVCQAHVVCPPSDGVCPNRLMGLSAGRLMASATAEDVRAA